MKLEVHGAGGRGLYCMEPKGHDGDFEFCSK